MNQLSQPSQHPVCSEAISHDAVHSNWVSGAPLSLLSTRLLPVLWLLLFCLNQTFRWPEVSSAWKAWSWRYKYRNDRNAAHERFGVFGSAADCDTQWTLWEWSWCRMEAELRNRDKVLEHWGRREVMERRQRLMYHLGLHSELCRSSLSLRPARRSQSRSCWAAGPLCTQRQLHPHCGHTRGKQVRYTGTLTHSQVPYCT